ncbi:MAG: hypothetical protein LC799_19580 [Actinobacteria bacterium]|nr:hypothetical protein [Actinomycetota bacterium]
MTAGQSPESGDRTSLLPEAAPPGSGIREPRTQRNRAGRTLAVGVIAAAAIAGAGLLATRDSDDPSTRTKAPVTAVTQPRADGTRPAAEQPVAASVPPTAAQDLPVPGPDGSDSQVPATVPADASSTPISPEPDLDPAPDDGTADGTGSGRSSGLDGGTMADTTD